MEISVKFIIEHEYDGPYGLATSETYIIPRTEGKSDFTNDEIWDIAKSKQLHYNWTKILKITKLIVEVSDPIDIKEP